MCASNMQVQVSHTINYFEARTLQSYKMAADVSHVINLTVSRPVIKPQQRSTQKIKNG